MSNRMIGLCAAALVVLGARGAEAAMLLVDMVPGGAVDSSRVQTPGDSFSVDILIDDASDLAGFEFEVEFDGSILSASSIDSGGIFGIDTFPVASTIGPGSIGFAEATLALTGVNVAAPRVLATIHFSVVSEGVSMLVLRNSLLSDSNAIEMAVDSETGGQLVAQRPPDVVPEPASVLLVSVGLYGLLVRRRRR